jgi:hypothetical protein
VALVAMAVSKRDFASLQHPRRHGDLVVRRQGGHLSQRWIQQVPGAFRPRLRIKWSSRRSSPGSLAAGPASATSGILWRSRGPSASFGAVKRQQVLRNPGMDSRTQALHRDTGLNLLQHRRRRTLALDGVAELGQGRAEEIQTG